jgi:general nucleoside transport system ATP-binding protein
VERDHAGLPALVQVDEKRRDGAVADHPERRPHLVLRGITKRYGSVVANDGVDLSIARGSIHAVVGENGAGKSTLMAVVFGLVSPDEGTIELAGEAIRPSGPHDALARGVGMVQQRFQLLEGLTALENLVLGHEPARGPLLDQQAALRRAEELASSLRIRMPWQRPVRLLSVGQRQRLEILRLLYRDASLLILDEPTTVLAPHEVEDLFTVLRRLREQGRTVIFISHKLREVQAIADRVTVMRSGRIVETLDARALDIGRVAELMVGDPRFASLAIDARSADEPAVGGAESGRAGGESLLRLEDVRVRGLVGDVALAGIEFEIAPGEIFGVAGVEGNGQRELVETIVGLRRPDSGRVTIAGRNVTRASVGARRAAGLAFISEDRDGEGVNLDGSIRDSLIALRFRRSPLSRFSVLRFAQIRRFVRSLMERFGVRGAGESATVRSLSGGNVQRTVLARELEGAPRVVVAAHPTRGVDVRGIAFVHEQLRAIRDGDGAVLLISEELDELLALSDRLVVLYEGRIVGALSRADFGDRARIGRLIAGAETA